MHQRLLKLTYLVSFGFLLIGCNGSGGGTTPTNGAPERVMGPLSTVSSSVPAALDQVFTDGTATSSSNLKSMEGDDDDDHRDFGNCSLTQNPEGGISITCQCRADGVSQGTVTHTFDKDVTRETCTKADGSFGSIITLDGTGTTTFEACSVKRCGTNLVIDGVVDNTVHHMVNTCEQTVLTMVDITTAEACSGLTVTEGDITSTIGFTVALTRDNGIRTFTGTVCIDSVSTEFVSLGELREIIDPAGMCRADIEDDDDQGEDNDDQGENQDED